MLSVDWQSRCISSWLPLATWILFAGDRNIYEIGIIILFIGGWMLCGLIGVYGIADGFVFSNLTLFWGGIGGVAGVGMVILIMVLAGFSGMAEILVRKPVTMKAFKENRDIAFVPHILVGYAVVIITVVQMLDLH